jgi:hypothetical protein
MYSSLNSKLILKNKKGDRPTSVRKISFKFA